MPLFLTDRAAIGAYGFYSAKLFPVGSNHGFPLSTGADCFVGLSNKPDVVFEEFRRPFPHDG